MLRKKTLKLKTTDLETQVGIQSLFPKYREFSLDRGCLRNAEDLQDTAEISSISSFPTLRRHRYRLCSSDLFSGKTFSRFRPIENFTRV